MPGPDPTGVDGIEGVPLLYTPHDHRAEICQIFNDSHEVHAAGILVRANLVSDPTLNAIRKRTNE